MIDQSIDRWTASLSLCTPNPVDLNRSIEFTHCAAFNPVCINANIDSDRFGIESFGMYLASQGGILRAMSNPVRSKPVGCAWLAVEPALSLRSERPFSGQMLLAMNKGLLLYTSIEFGVPRSNSAWVGHGPCHHHCWRGSDRAEEVLRLKSSLSLRQSFCVMPTRNGGVEYFHLLPWPAGAQ